MTITCRCMNFIVEVQSFLDLQIVRLELTAVEKNHPYFSKDVYHLNGRISTKTEVYPTLIKSEMVGSWNIHKCLVCKMFTCATNYVNGFSTCSSSLQEITDLGNVKHLEEMNYSQVFQICFPMNLEVWEDPSSPIPESEIVDHGDLQQIHLKANSYLEMVERTLSENPGTLNDEQRQDLESCKRRVYSETKWLIEMLITAKKDVGPSDNFLLSDVCCTSPPEEPHCIDSDLQERELQDSFQRLQMKMENVLIEDYSDNEGIFDMDDIGPLHRTKSDPPPYVPDDFSDDCISSGFRREYKGLEEIAKSAPLDVPPWPSRIPRHRDEQQDERRPTDPAEIAASMKEMARNMRVSSVDVFGDLPRPQLPKDVDPYLLK